MPEAYVVSSGDYSDYSVDCVFLDKAAAEEYVERRNRQERYGGYRVEEFPLYEDQPRLWTEYRVNLWVNPPAHRLEDTGAMFDFSDVVVGDEPVFVPARVENTVVTSSGPDLERWTVVTSSGPDLERCRKSCRDLYARVVAEREGIS